MKAPKDYLVFPLDVETMSQAEALTRLLADQIGMFKVGLELFIHAGPRVIGMIRQHAPSARIFLDLKLHDIPATVGRAMSRVAEMEVDLVTVHCGESPAMLEAAVRGGGERVGVLGVTVLTSISPEDIRNAGYEKRYADHMDDLVLNRARQARAAGCAGIVCSGREAGRLKQELGRDFLAVTPGIRPAWDGVSAHDQKRVVTPDQAVLAGADLLVIGRPIRDAADPAEAAARIAGEIDQAISGAAAEQERPSA